MDFIQIIAVERVSSVENVRERGFPVPHTTANIVCNILSRPVETINAITERDMAVRFSETELYSPTVM